jgi:DNA-binding transcriptional LysR family regulator
MPRGVPLMELPLRNADWDSIRVFIAVAQSESFRQAVDRLGMSINTVRRIIKRLEDQLGFALLFRDAEGVSLTPEGRRVIVAARDVEKTVQDLWRVAAGVGSTMTAPVRVAVTDRLGTFWLTPRLVQFIDDDASPKRVEVQCAMGSVDVLRLEADISVQLVQPTNPGVTARQLGYLHLVPFASPEYLERYGTPRRITDLVQHRIVEQTTDQVTGVEEFFKRTFSAEIAEQVIRFRTNFSSVNYWSIAKGAGIGMLPNYARKIGGRLVHVDLGIVYTVKIWMASHAEVLKTKRHREFADLIADSFDRKAYPWFGEKFLSPADIDRLEERPELEDCFRGFVATR